MMIDKIIHQIWIGSKEPPLKQMNTWKNKHKKWEYVLWDNDSIKELEMYNTLFFKKALSSKNFILASDILTYEILYKFGGLYVDASSTCFKNVYSLIKSKDVLLVESPRNSSIVTSAYVGAKKNHFFTEDIYNFVKSKLKTGNYGALSSRQSILTSFIDKHNLSDHIIEPGYLYQKDFEGNDIEFSGTNYATHEWGESKSK